MKAILRPVLGLVALLALQGCYIPPVWDIGDEIDYVDSITVGETTRQEVINLIGEPHSRDEANDVFHYAGSNSYGTYIAPCPDFEEWNCGLFDEERWSLSIQFDENDIVNQVTSSDRDEPLVD